MNVSQRSVFLIGGYDPKTAEAFFARLGREIARFEQTWGVAASVSPVAPFPGGAVRGVHIVATGDGWRVETDFGFLELDTIVLKDFARPAPVRLYDYLVTFGDYVLSGTFFRMLATAPRFALYFLYPFTMLAVFAAASIIVAVLMASLVPGISSLLAAILAAVLFAIVCGTLGRRGWVLHLMDLWSFSRNFLRGRRPDGEAHLQRLAEAVVAHAKEGGRDEILLVGHSTGGGLVLDIAARCLEIDPDFAARSRNTAILTLGSTALKLGMHPAAHAFRSRVQTLVDEPRLQWVEIQCLTDIINFYKTDPVAAMGLRPHAGEGEARNSRFPMVRSVRVREMLDAATYKRIKRNFFRVHYQYIFGNTKKYWYDFFMICCGPLPLAERTTGAIVGASRNPKVLP